MNEQTKAERQAAIDAQAAQAQTNQNAAQNGGIVQPPPPPPHITQAPQGSGVPYPELQKHVTGEQTVAGGIRSFVQGVKQRLEEIVGNDGKDPNAVRQELRQLSGELDSDAWTRAVMSNTASQGEADPQANRPVSPQINR